MTDIDITIIGGGVVGLALAYELSAFSPVLLEAENSLGRGISSRNSEVIHAGIYYPSDFLKTSLCIEGNRLLYGFCQKHDLPHRRIGKLIAAGSETEIPSLEKLFKQGQINGVEGLQLLDRHEIKKIEPNLRAAAALFSPNTGIVDSHQLMRRLELCADGDILCNSTVTAIEPKPGRFICTVNDEYQFCSRIIITAAGLRAAEVAALAGIDSYRIYPVKGEYFRLKASKSNICSHLIYPSPEQNLAGLGIHLTKDLSGAVRLGPNTVYQNNYDVDPAHAKEFAAGIQKLLPIDERDLQPDMAGLRPKLNAPGEPARDFIIRHELEGMLNLIGIESPGLTSCLAIAKYVKKLMLQDGLLSAG